MQTYPRNSPQAAARIVALMLTADGHVCSSEERALDKLDIAGQLGLLPEQFAQIVQTLCEDHAVAHAPHAPMAGPVDKALLATLMGEIDSPALQRKVMRLCVAAASADDYLADGEIALLGTVFSAWAPASSQAVVRRNTLHAHKRLASTT
ncbi:hypothetical protein P3T43_006415 [Paraburkholderia sp. GAS41]|uniref:TerB family tellurite resistance protein n=1 Tax=Paraburkholderia sp. GAS41 TaxID=3035134 RepID=UPI003D19259E